MVAALMDNRLSLVCDDLFSRSWLARPNAIKNLRGFIGFEFLARGVYFHTLLGAGIPPNLRRMCCASASYKYIFRRSCADKSVPVDTTSEAAYGAALTRLLRDLRTDGQSSVATRTL
jgi:hypothetical protein